LDARKEKIMGKREPRGKKNGAKMNGKNWDETVFGKLKIVGGGGGGGGGKIVKKKGLFLPTVGHHS